MSNYSRRYRGIQSRLGRGGGARSQLARSKMYRRGNRQFVPRTMGPFANSESKYFDSYVQQNLSEGAASWAGSEMDPTTLNTLVCPQEGSDIDNRIGRKIAVYKLSLRGVITTAAVSDAPDVLANPCIRLILFIDQQTNGTQAQAEQLMADPGTVSLPLVFCTFQNLENLGRFRVLRDIILRPSIVTSGTDGASTLSLGVNDIPFKITVKFKKPIIMKFNATNGGTIGDIVDNSFHLIGHKSGTGFTTNINYHCRAYYKDQ